MLHKISVILFVAVQISGCVTTQPKKVEIHKSSSSLSPDPIPRKDGKDVVLNENGTWKFADELNLSEVAPIKMEIPSFEGSPSQETKAVSPIAWKLKSSKRNSITDNVDWFYRNKISFPFCRISNSRVQNQSDCIAQTPQSYRENRFLSGVFDDPYQFLVYGSSGSNGQFLVMVHTKTLKVEKIYDFENYKNGPKFIPEDRDYVTQSIRWARRVGDTLYVSHSHMTYAKSSFGQNAYITAIDLKTDQVLWRTKPLMSNSVNFEILNDVIVTGYGFTAEKHFLYQINRFTGEKISELLIRKSPEYIIKKENTLFVRTYDADLEYEVPAN